ncbi:hypothetical protein L798_14955 [Zootermopsis nevadensis]|uniref:Uncharacterized protein n=1 Tax=Zootermopsis nevadensis TaxID=136037 RepID=A0A067QYG6_ZOONE|nr:hypothetical protein L798_14955 [Zootermopsis nevadensis]
MINQTENVEEQWESLKKNMLETAREVIGIQKAKNRKEWITEDIVEKTEKRRKLKNDPSEEGRRQCRALRNEINREARKAKERHLEVKCKEVDELTKEGKLERAYKTIKQFFGNRRIKCIGIQTE